MYKNKTSYGAPPVTCWFYECSKCDYAEDEDGREMPLIEDAGKIFDELQRKYKRG